MKLLNSETHLLSCVSAGLPPPPVFPTLANKLWSSTQKREEGQDAMRYTCDTHLQKPSHTTGVITTWQTGGISWNTKNKQSSNMDVRSGFNRMQNDLKEARL